jgi:hypothetical protein
MFLSPFRRRIGEGGRARQSGMKKAARIAPGGSFDRNSAVDQLL